MLFNVIHGILFNILGETCQY